MVQISLLQPSLLSPILCPHCHNDSPAVPYGHCSGVSQIRVVSVGGIEYMVTSSHDSFLRLWRGSAVVTVMSAGFHRLNDFIVIKGDDASG